MIPINMVSTKNIGIDGTILKLKEHDFKFYDYIDVPYTFLIIYVLKLIILWARMYLLIILQQS